MKSVLRIKLFLAILLWMQIGCSGPQATTYSANNASSAVSPNQNPNSNPGATPGSSPGSSRVSPSPGNWVNVTSNLAGMASECGNMTYVSAKPGEDLMIAGIARQGLWGSTDGGASWHPLGSAPGSAKIVNRPGSIVYDPIHSDVFWESGIYNSNGVYRTDNDGDAFSALGSIGHIDTVSVDFTDTNRQTLLAGGHERKQTVYRSRRMAAELGQMWEPASQRARHFPVIRWSLTRKLFSRVAIPAGPPERAAFFRATTREPSGTLFRPRVEAPSRL